MNQTSDNVSSDNDNDYRRSNSNSPVRQFCRRFSRNDATLTICNLHSVPAVTNRGALQLAASLAGRHSNLVVLFCDNCTLSDAGVVALSASLQQQPHLKYLYLSYNSIGNRGAMALAELIKPTCARQATACQLATLKLAHNKIGSAGAVRLAEALKQHISKNNSRNNDDFAAATTTMTEPPSSCCCSTLEILDLEGNAIQQDGLEALSDSLVDNTHLRELHVKGNLCRHSKHHLLERRVVQDTFCRVLEHHNTTLRHLQLDQTTTAPDSPRTQSPLIPGRCPEPKESEVCERIDYWLALNRLGRHFFGSTTIPAAAWTRVLARAATSKNPNDRQRRGCDPRQQQPSLTSRRDLVYALLQARPDLLEVTNTSIQNHTSSNVGTLQRSGLT